MKEEETKASVRIRHEYFTLLFNYTEYRNYIRLYLDTQETREIYVRLILQAVMKMMKDCLSLCAECRKYASELEAAIDLVSMDYE